MAKRMHVLISGAGIAGLTTALALLQRGFQVRLYEQAPELAEIGGGLQIAPDGTRVLLELGLREAMEAVVCEAAYKDVRLWDSGERRRLFDLGEDCRNRFGAPYWFVHRSDLQRALLNAVAELDPDALCLGKECHAFRDTGTQVEVTFQDGETATGDVLIGADGVHSRIRDQMFPSPRAQYTGIVAWRGVVRMEDLPEELREPAGTNWVGPGGHVVTYPLRRGSVLNFVGNVEGSHWTDESWTRTGTREECARDFVGWHELVHTMIRAVDQPYKLALVGRPPLRDWAAGRVVLVGDAAHPTLPFLAHGSIMALEDGMVLARCIEDTPDAPEHAFKRFVATRIGRATAIVEGSAQNAGRFHNPLLADPHKARAYLDDQWRPEKVRQRYDWLFEYDATLVPLADVHEQPKKAALAP